MAPISPETPRKMAEAGSQTDLDPRIELALDFGSNLFDGIIAGTEIGGRQRRQFTWPQSLEVKTEDRILIVLRALKKVGFPTLGSFLFEAFRNDVRYNKHPSVYHTLASFLQAKEHSPSNHPIAIVDLIFRHRKSQEYINWVPLEPNFVLPRYALPPSIRAAVIIPVRSPNTAHNAMSIALPAKKLDAKAVVLVEESAEPPAVAPDPGTVTDNLPFAPESAAAPAPQSPPNSATVPVVDSDDGEDDPDPPPNDTESTEEPSAPKMFIDPIGRRDPFTASILVLLAFRNRFAIMFPILIGIFAFTCNANREFISGLKLLFPHARLRSLRV
ncbi:hypothetical protein DFH09DRAFT_1339806 [Mycena vulgaris]|nr:hypothetical protein DFH09DRAFT_1339806 [Mycena vulgaris]